MKLKIYEKNHFYHDLAWHIFFLTACDQDDNMEFQASETTLFLDHFLWRVVMGEQMRGKFSV